MKIEKNKQLKVCILFSSYEGRKYIFQDYDKFPDPSTYVSDENYHFQKVFLKKSTAEEQINSLVSSENFDIIVSFL
jgi:hypothetical protein